NELQAETLSAEAVEAKLTQNNINLTEMSKLRILIHELEDEALSEKAMAQMKAIAVKIIHKRVFQFLQDFVDDSILLQKFFKPSEKSLLNKLYINLYKLLNNQNIPSLMNITINFFAFSAGKLVVDKPNFNRYSTAFF